MCAEPIYDNLLLSGGRETNLSVIVWSQQSPIIAVCMESGKFGWSKETHIFTQVSACSIHSSNVCMDRVPSIAIITNAVPPGYIQQSKYV